MPNINSGKPWSAMDLSDLRNGLHIGAPIEELADFLCHDVEEVRAKVGKEEESCMRALWLLWPISGWAAWLYIGFSNSSQAARIPIATFSDWSYLSALVRLCDRWAIHLAHPHP